MNEIAKLKVIVLERINKSTTKIKGKMQDETPFEIVVKNSLLEMIEDSAPQQAWLNVEYNGRHYGDVSITLPVPILIHGKKITVSGNDVKVIS